MHLMYTVWVTAKTFVPSSYSYSSSSLSSYRERNREILPNTLNYKIICQIPHQDVRQRLAEGGGPPEQVPAAAVLAAVAATAAAAGGVGSRRRRRWLLPSFLSDGPCCCCRILVCCFVVQRRSAKICPLNRQCKKSNRPCENYPYVCGSSRVSAAAGDAAASDGGELKLFQDGNRVIFFISLDDRHFPYVCASSPWAASAASAASATSPPPPPPPPSVAMSCADVSLSSALTSGEGSLALSASSSSFCSSSSSVSTEGGDIVWRPLSPSALLGSSSLLLRMPFSS